MRYGFLAVLMAGCLVVLTTCGSSASGDKGSIATLVRSSMRNLPYRYHILRVTHAGYAVVRAKSGDGLGVDFAVARSRNHSCAPLPQLSHQRLRSSPDIIGSSGSDKVMCFGDDVVRHGDSDYVRIQRINIITAVAHAFCVNVAGEFECIG
jgi:hypothetical protein